MSNPYNVSLDMSELRERKKPILNILKPLVNKPDALHIVPRSINKEEFILVAVQKGSTNNTEYKDQKFKTTSNSIYASYYERWFRYYLGKQEVWYLERAYLHLYKVTRTESTELLLLHCDPNEVREHAVYKKSPHLHIVTAPDPWPHAHIALNVGYLENMLESASSLTKTFGLVIHMLKDQILVHEL